jgi:hypothetical protein
MLLRRRKIITQEITSRKLPARKVLSAASLAESDRAVELIAELRAKTIPRP